MATIQNAITMQDRMTPVFNSMIKAMHSTLNIMQKVDLAANNGISSKAFQKATKDIEIANNAVLRFSNSTNIANGAGNRLSNTFGRLSSLGLNAFGAQALVSTVGQVNNLISRTTAYMDNITSIKARLDLVNDGLRTTEQLQDNIFAAANRSRKSYDDMAKSVSKLNMLAGDQFATNNEAIQFMETLNKMFAVSGTGAQEASAAMYQLTQAMGSGVLQGDEFRSIMENAPMLLNAIANSLGVTRGQLKSMASDGEITADVVKKAMFDATDSINKQFETLPKTFGQMSQIAKNHIQKAFEPLAGQFSQWLQSDSAQAFFDTIIIGATISAQVFGVAMEIITGTIQFLHQVIQGIQPILSILAVLLLAIGIAVLPIVIGALWGAATALWSTASAAIATAISFMLINWPITLAVILIMLLIATVMSLGVTFGQIIGFIMGLLYALVAVVYNIIVMIINAFIILATFLYNVFTNPMAAVKMLFYDMAAFAVDQVLWIAQALEDLVNMLPGVNITITAELENIKSKILAAKAEVAAESGAKNANTIDYKNVGKQFSKGFNSGNNFVNSFGGGGSKKPSNPSISKPSTSGMGGAASKPSKGAGGSGGNKLGGGKLDEIGKIKDDIKITDEDIKLLKDIASTQFVNQYTTLRPEMKIQFGDVHENVDINKVIEAIEDMTEEALANVIIEEVS